MGSTRKRSLLVALFLLGPGSLLASPKEDLRWPSLDHRLSYREWEPTQDLQVALSLDDLGFSKTETQSDPQLQKDLETRSDMLKIHQTLGLITCIPMLTNYVLGLTGTGKDDLLLHGGIGFATTGLYLTTASFAIFAPHVKGVKPSGNSELHQVLAIIHGVCMVATPILGELGEDNPGFATAHFISTTGLVASFVTAMAVMTF